MRNNKKKGFTLIELIAVIAILAILGAILVPNIMAYRKKAEKSSIQTSASTILNAINVYNSDQDSDANCIGDSSAAWPGTHNYSAGITLLDTEGTLSKAKIPGCLGGTTSCTTVITKVADLEKIASGNFSVNNVSGLASTITY